MKILNKFLFIFILASFAACSDGTDDISGESGPCNLEGSVVMDGEPVNGAAVLLTPSQGTKITGSDGFFSFKDIPEGTYEVKVYKEGCLPFNQTITLSKNKVAEVVLTISPNSGSLRLNKGFIDLGANEGNNIAAFTITNIGAQDIQWEVSKGATWISRIEPTKGSIPAEGAAVVTIQINRNALSTNDYNNHTTVVVKSSSPGDGSLAELLITAFGTGNGQNIENNNSDLDYVVLGDLYVQTSDLSPGTLEYLDAARLCQNSIKGGYTDWRLPTIEELALISQNYQAVGGLKYNEYYMSCSYYGTTLLMGIGTTRNGMGYVRAVRTIE